MLLSDKGINNALNRHDLAIEPYDPALLQPCSVDVRLDRYFRVFQNHRYAYIDPREEQDDLTELVEVGDGEPFILHPGEFVLGSTLEKITVGVHHAARLEGKSSLGRLGLLVHSTAGFVDAGFDGWVTLELANVANLPIKLWPGMRIGQLCVFELNTASTAPYGHRCYGSRYQHQPRGPQPSRAHRNFRTWPTRPAQPTHKEPAPMSDPAPALPPPRKLVFVDTEYDRLDVEQANLVELAFAVGDEDVQSGVPPHSITGAAPKALEINRYHERGLGDPAGWDPGIIDLLGKSAAGNTLVGANPRVDARILARAIGSEPWHYRLGDVENMAWLLLGFDHLPGLREITEKLLDLGWTLPEPDHSAAADVQTTRAVFRILQRSATYLLRDGVPRFEQVHNSEIEQG